jgi:uncharacterized protein involved in exopolysaccharide biosynthesis
MRFDPETDHSAALRRFVEIAWRWKTWLIAATAISAAAGLALVAVTPKLYRATTTIIVTRQSVPESIVRSAVSMGIEERLKNLKVQLFSRAYLEVIAREFTLVPADADENAIEAACDDLRKRVSTEMDLRGFSWFRISVEDGRPERAAGIANRLAALFMEQNSRMRASQAAGAVELTEGWEDRYRAELAQRDVAIEEFNRRHVDALPDQQEADALLLSGAQSRAAQLTTDLRTRRDDLAALRAERERRPAAEAGSGEGDVSVETLQAEITALLTSYTESNPLVKRKRARLAELVRSLPEEPATGGPPSAARVDPTDGRIAALEDEIKRLDDDRERETAGVASYRAKMASAPIVQQERLDLMRGYDQVKTQFDDAAAQTEQAQRSQQLEQSNKGEQFQVQDIAHPPVTPETPDPFRYVLVSMGFGLMIGAGGIGARELVVQTVRTEKEFAADFPELPVYGVIPNLRAGTATRRRA